MSSTVSTVIPTAVPDLLNSMTTLLQVPSAEGIEILDAVPEKQLYLVHYKENADMSVFGHVRGIVVDMKHNVVVCKSFGYTPTVEANTIALNTETKNFTFTDENGKVHDIPEKEAQFRTGYEGTVIRAFKHDGAVYFSTHRNLNADRSRWGGTTSFLQMYKELKGPDADTLFGTETTSPYCHLFLVMHPNVTVATKLTIGNGHIMYLGAKVFGDVKENTFQWKNDEGKSGIVSPASLTLTQANNHLQFGTYEPFDVKSMDPRMTPGEFVIIYRVNTEGDVLSLLRVASSSYEWRRKMIDNNPNIKHRVFQLLDDSYIRAETKEGYEAFTAKYPLLPKMPKTTPELLKFVATDPIVAWPTGQPNTSYFTREDRLQNICYCLMMCVPLHRQKAVLQSYLDMIKERNAVIQWLQDFAMKRVKNVNPRVDNILMNAVKYAQQRQTRGQDITPDGRRLNLGQMIRENIRNLMYKERGTSLYRLVKAMNETAV